MLGAQKNRHIETVLFEYHNFFHYTLLKAFIWRSLCSTKRNPLSATTGLLNIVYFQAFKLSDVTASNCVDANNLAI